jgi:hypothetical protein
MSGYCEVEVISEPSWLDRISEIIGDAWVKLTGHVVESSFAIVLVKL